MPRRNKRREKMRDEEARFWQERDKDEEDERPVKRPSKKKRGGNQHDSKS